MDSAPTHRRMADGFLERGAQVTRLEAFVDAAFAASFLQLAMFWYAHARWSRRYGLDDRMTTFLSLLLVFLALVYIYPLKMMFGTFFAWVSDGWFPWPLDSLRGYRDIRIMFMVYGIAFATLSLCISALYVRALSQADALGLDREERALTAGEIAFWWLAVAVAALSTLCAALLPHNPSYWLSGAPGMIYFLLNLSWLVSRAAHARSLRRSAGEGG